jgi:HTH-type transcriptional regulator/antitoxin HigA
MTRAGGKVTLTTSASSSYAELLAQYQPHAIRNEQDAERIQELIDTLIDREELTDDEEEFLALLGSLIFMWEADGKYNLRDVPPHEVVKALLEARGLRQQALVGPVFPTKGIASEVLSGKRRLTYDFVERLSHFFDVSPETFFTTSGRERIPHAIRAV